MESIYVKGYSATERGGVSVQCVGGSRMTDVALALWSGTLGVVAGTIVTLVGSYFQQRWSFSKQLQERQEQARVGLVREIMRWRLDQGQLVLRLNELPLLFGHDAETMRLYRALISAKDGAEGTRVLGDLVAHVAKLVGLDGGVQPSDISTGFHITNS